MATPPARPRRRARSDACTAGCGGASICCSRSSPRAVPRRDGDSVWARPRRPRTARAMFGGVSYLDFVAPGLMAASAMQVAANESIWPVLGGFKWVTQLPRRGRDPISAGEIVVGTCSGSCTRAVSLASACSCWSRPCSARCRRRRGHPRHPGGGPHAAWRSPAPLVGVLGDARQRRRRSRHHALRRAAAVPVLGHVLPDQPAPRRLRPIAYVLAAVARRGPVPGRWPTGTPTSAAVGRCTSLVSRRVRGRPAWWPRCGRSAAGCTRERPTTLASRRAVAGGGPAVAPLGAHGRAQRRSWYRRIWLIFVSGFFEPVLFLLLDRDRRRQARRQRAVRRRACRLHGSSSRPACWRRRR